MCKRGVIITAKLVCKGGDNKSVITEPACQKECDNKYVAILLAHKLGDNNFDITPRLHEARGI